MCGVAGYIHYGKCTKSCSEVAKLVNDSQSCRGPDGQYVWHKEAESVNLHLYHQRLSIQDLSSKANQPMQSSINPNVNIVFNGEIYNKIEIQALLGCSFIPKTSSDTEILLESLVQFGFDAVLPAIRGMFAIALIEDDSQTLTLARDKFGEKPLHYWHDDKQMFFSSHFDVAARSRRTLGLPNQLNHSAVDAFLLLGYFPHKNSMISEIYKVYPGQLVKFDFSNFRIKLCDTQDWTQRWSAKHQSYLQEGMFLGSLRSAVQEQLIGDVPVGVFLSGGCDSTIISALAQECQSAPIHSFSLGFDESSFDESSFASLAAKEIGTEHHSFKMSSLDAIDILPHVLKAFSEPLADPSVFPTTFLSKKVSETVSVALTGDGADELFYGYGRYNRFTQLARLRTSPLVTANSLQLLNKIIDFIPMRDIKKLRQRLASLVHSKSLSQDYLSLVGLPLSNMLLLKPSLSEEVARYSDILWSLAGSVSTIDKLREIDVRSYLCDDILVKVDRASMAFGLETRAPFLDHRVQSLAASAPKEWLLGPENKQIIKDSLGKFVSKDIFMRPKQGFGAPIGNWFRTSLKDWIVGVANETEWNALGIDEREVKSLLDNHLMQRFDNSGAIWALCALANSVRELKL